MSLAGLPFLLLVAGVAVAVCAAVAVLWQRWPRRAAWPARSLSLVLVMAVGAVLAGTAVNHDLVFYTSVRDLLGRPDVAEPPSTDHPVTRLPGGVLVLTHGWQALGRRRALHGEGTVLQVRLAGPRSGIVRPGTVYLPAAWFGRVGRALPLVELLHGYPGIQGNWTRQLHVASVLDREIRASRLQPVVAVMPHTYSGRASECVDAATGERDDTYLALDVPEDVQRGFGTLPGKSLGLLGYSEGGFCALDLGLHHPDEVAAAVSLSGYTTAGTDPHTRDLYRGRPGLLQHDSPLWLVRHTAPAAPPLLLVASEGDPEASADDRVLVRTAAVHAPRMPVQAALLTSGGHDFATWEAELPASLDFLAAHLPAPLAPPQRLPPDPAVTSRAAAAPGPAARR